MLSWIPMTLPEEMDFSEKSEPFTFVEQLPFLFLMKHCGLIWHLVKKKDDTAAEQLNQVIIDYPGTVIDIEHHLSDIIAK